MTTPSEEQRFIDAAVARVVAEAPPLPAEVAEMLRRDRCPILGRQRRGEAA